MRVPPFLSFASRSFLPFGRSVVISVEAGEVVIVGIPFVRCFYFVQRKELSHLKRLWC